MKSVGRLSYFTKDKAVNQRRQGRQLMQTSFHFQRSIKVRSNCPLDWESEQHYGDESIAHSNYHDEGIKRTVSSDEQRVCYQSTSSGYLIYMSLSKRFYSTLHLRHSLIPPKLLISI